MCIASIIMLTIADVEEHIDIRISLSYHLIIIRFDTSNAMHHIHSHIHTDTLPPWRYTHMHTTITHAYMTPSVHVHAWKRMGGPVGMHRARCPSHGTLSDRAHSPHATGAPRTCMCGTSPNPHHPTPRDYSIPSCVVKSVLLCAWHGGYRYRWRGPGSGRRSPRWRPLLVTIHPLAFNVRQFCVVLHTKESEITKGAI